MSVLCSEVTRWLCSSEHGPSSIWSHLRLESRFFSSEPSRRAPPRGFHTGHSVHLEHPACFSPSSSFLGRSESPSVERPSRFCARTSPRPPISTAHPLPCLDLLHGLHYLLEYSASVCLFTVCLSTRVELPGGWACLLRIPRARHSSRHSGATI